MAYVMWLLKIPYNLEAYLHNIGPLGQYRQRDGAVDVFGKIIPSSQESLNSSAYSSYLIMYLPDVPGIVAHH